MWFVTLFLNPVLYNSWSFTGLPLLFLITINPYLATYHGFTSCSSIGHNTMTCRHYYFFRCIYAYHIRLYLNSRAPSRCNHYLPIRMLGITQPSYRGTHSFPLRFRSLVTSLIGSLSVSFSFFFFLFLTCSDNSYSRRS
jgi:hypothetical protein